MAFTDFLRILAKNDGSDLYLSTGASLCKIPGHAKTTEQRRHVARPG